MWSDFSKLQVPEFVRDALKRVCAFVGVEVLLSDKGTRLEPPGFIWAKQEGAHVCLRPLFCPQWGLRATNRRCLFITHTWALPSLGPTSLSISLRIHTASFLSVFRYPLYPLRFSPRPWPGLLLPLPLWTLWCRLCWPFPQIMCTFGNGTFCSILRLFMNIHFTQQDS